MVVFYYLLLLLKLIPYINIDSCGEPNLGLVAQLVRALRRHRRGLQFESARAHIKYSNYMLNNLFAKKNQAEIEENEYPSISEWAGEKN